MKIKIDDVFLSMAKEIIAHNKSNDEWSLIESDDTFQTENYEGGYDATEQAFCFSYYDNQGEEYWFQLKLEEIKKIIEKEINEIDVLKPN